jgi:hypothetical protein
MTATERKQTRVPASSELMNQVGALQGRRAGTQWTVAEAMALRAVNPPPEEVEAMAAYYGAHIGKDKDFRRRDLITLLNNWNGELDRARIHASE